MSPRPSKAYAVRRGGADIVSQPAAHAVNTGIEYAAWVPGLVPPYEEDDARVQAHYTLAAWDALGAVDRAREVAHYRLRKLVTLHSSDAQASEAERAALRAAHK